MRRGALEIDVIFQRQLASDTRVIIYSSSMNAIAFVSLAAAPLVRRTSSSVARRARSLTKSTFIPTRSTFARPLSAMPAAGDGSTPTVATAAAPTATEAPEAPVEKFLKDYQTPNFLVDDVRLDFDLDDDGLDTKVYSKLVVKPDCPPGTPLVLDGELITLIPGSLKIDGKELAPKQYVISEKKGTLTIQPEAVPAGKSFVLESRVAVKPAKNTALEGLYMSSGNYCTQCEAEGFRRITYFPGWFSPSFGLDMHLCVVYAILTTLSFDRLCRSTRCHVEVHRAHLGKQAALPCAAFEW